MTTAPEHDVTSDIAALQRLPEDEQPPGVYEPTCATTGVTANAVSRPADADSRTGPDADTDDAAEPDSAS